MNVEICWIFISSDSANNALSVDYCSDDLLDYFLELHSEKMLYYRCFDHVMDAITYKKYLCGLSHQVLELIIKQMNPRNCDLKPMIVQMISI